MTQQAVTPPSQSGVWRLMLEREGPDRRNLPQDPQAAPIAGTPAREASAPASLPQAPQTISTSFTGATLADTGAFPPDTMGAAGPTQFFVHVNGRVRTFDKTTGVADGVINADTDVFFASVMSPFPGGGLNFTTDPQVRYDRLTKRWFLIIIDVPSSSPSSIGDIPNRVLIAVSDAASNGVLTPTTVWTYYFIQQNTVGGVSTGEFLDYPSLGVDNNALYIGGVMFGAVSGSFTGSSAFVVRKTSVMSGGPIITTAFRGLLDVVGEGPFAPRGVDNYDAAATEGYFIGVSNSVFGRLNMRRIGTPGGAPTISADIPISVNTTVFPEPVPHFGNTGGANGRLDALDDRLFAAHIRNGRLWTAHNIEVNASGVASTIGNRDASRWYELIVPVGTGTPTVNQSGTIFDPAANNPRYYWIPSVTVSGQGHAVFGFSSAGNNDRINAATNGRLRTDTLGASGTVELYTASSTDYNPPGDPGGSFGRRWGDYSFVSVDPNDDMTMWTIQQFCDATNSYGVRVVKLLAPPPATPATALPNAVPPGNPSQNITITGSSTAGSEFFDPGTGFANRIAAAVSGGVTVNSITFTDATHVTLNVSTVGTPVGSKNVTITNPDGQLRTGTGVITVSLTAFSDDPLTAGTVIKAVHITELRSRINTVRATYLLGPYPYTESVSVGTVIKASHILEMRAALAAVYTAAGQAQPTYTTTPGVGVTIVVADIAQLRTALVNIGG